MFFSDDDRLAMFSTEHTLVGMAITNPPEVAQVQQELGSHRSHTPYHRKSKRMTSSFHMVSRWVSRVNVNNLFLIETVMPVCILLSFLMLQNMV